MIENEILIVLLDKGKSYNLIREDVARSLGQEFMEEDLLIQHTLNEM